MITAKASFPKENTPPANAPEHISVSSHVADTGYQRLELLLIGFASVFITFLWVGVFSAVLQDRAVRIPFAGDGRIAGAVRNVADYVGLTATGILDAGEMAADTVAYQFTTIWETSCLTQQGCIGGLETVSAKTAGLVAIVDNIASSSQLLVSVVRDASSLRIPEAGGHLVQVVLPGRAYAADVLGASTISPEAVLQKGVTRYYQYVDTMTFGAISAINADLVGTDPDSTQN